MRVLAIKSVSIRAPFELSCHPTHRALKAKNPGTLKSSTLGAPVLAALAPEESLWAGAALLSSPSKGWIL